MKGQPNNTSKETVRRWYDHQQPLCSTLKLLRQFPAEVTAIVSDGLVYLAERRYQADQSHSIRRNIGRERVLSLYKSKNKRRFYDTVPSLHKAMNYHFVMPQSIQKSLSEDSLEMVMTVVDYFSLCNQREISPTLNQLQLITIFYVENGKDGVRRYLDAIAQSVVGINDGQRLNTTNQVKPISLKEVTDILLQPPSVSASGESLVPHKETAATGETTDEDGVEESSQQGKPASKFKHPQIGYRRSSSA